MTLPGLLFGIAATQQVKQQAHRGSRLIRTTVFSVKAVRQYQALQFIRLKTLLEKITERAREEPQQSTDFVTLDATEAPVHSPRLRYFRHALCIQVRRRLQEERLQVSCKLLEFFLGLEKGFDVVWCDARQFSAHLVFVRPPANDIAVIKRGLYSRVTRNHLQSVRTQLQVFDDSGSQHAGDVGGGRHPATRR